MVKKEAVIFSFALVAVLLIAGCQGYLNKAAVGSRATEVNWKGVAGDYNGDGCVDAYQENNQLKGKEGELFAKYFSEGNENADVDANGDVNFDDFQIFVDAAQTFKCRGAEKLPDLVIASVRLDDEFMQMNPFYPEDVVWIIVSVVNVGNAPAIGVNNKFSNIEPGLFDECTTRWIPELFPGETIDVEVFCRKIGDSYGNKINTQILPRKIFLGDGKEVSVYLDDPDVNKENNEKNNAYTTTLRTISTRGPIYTYSDIGYTGFNLFFANPSCMGQWNSGIGKSCNDKCGAERQRQCKMAFETKEIKDSATGAGTADKLRPVECSSKSPTFSNLCICCNKL